MKNKAGYKKKKEIRNDPKAILNFFTNCSNSILMFTLLQVFILGFVLL